jgi:hypothetical protein
MQELHRNADEALRAYVESHLLPRPVAVWIRPIDGDDAPLDEKNVRHVQGRFDVDWLDDWKVLIRPASPIEAELICEKAEDAGLWGRIDDGYFEDELWPPPGAVPTGHLMFALAEIATRAWCTDPELGDGGSRGEIIDACETLFRYLGWTGRSNLRSIIEVASDGLTAPDGGIPVTQPLSDTVRRIITPLVREGVEVGAEMVTEPDELS